MKTRIYDLGKELGIDSKSLVDLLLALGHEAKSHMSGIPEDAANEIRILHGVAPVITEPKKKKKIIKKIIKKRVVKKIVKKIVKKKKPAAVEKAPAEKEPKPVEELPIEPVAEAPAAESVVEKAVEEAKPVVEMEEVPAKAETPAATEEGVENSVAQEDVKEETKPEEPKAETPTEEKAPKTKIKPKKSAPKAKSRIIGKIDLPAAEKQPRPGNKRRGGNQGGGQGAGGEGDGRGRRFQRKKKVFFTRDGQPLYHSKQKRKNSQQKIVIPDDLAVTLPISVKDLSALIGVKAQSILRKLMLDGHMIRVNDPLPADLISLIGLEHGKQIEIQDAKTVEDKMIEQVEAADNPEDLVERAPVITFLGHVDHGKTSLLDYIRKARVVDGEAGGITQHIGAYQVVTHDKKITFLDTPGHEAFTSMRARGANITDLVVLVVAADDGVMPQTEEAINHANAAGVPIVVAVNKTDRPEADPMRVRQQLSTLDLAPEEWGGKTIFMDVSAITGTGVDELIDMLCLESEMLELKANPNRAARGTVIESRLTEGQGVITSVLVSHGTLRKGDIILSGTTFGRVRTLRDDAGKIIEEAGPSTPVSVIGFPEPPGVGDPFRVLKNLRTAREVADMRAVELRDKSLSSRSHVTLETLFTSIEQGKTKELNVILKGDVRGSVEVLLSSLTDLSTGEIKVNVIHAAVGGITESDVLLADASNAIIIGFHVVPEDKARIQAQQIGVQIRVYQIIYEVIDDVRSAMEGMLEPEARETIQGHAEVRNTFKVSHSGTIAGCYMTDGKIERSSKVRLIRDSVIIHEGSLASLRRFKDDVREVKEGFECGIRLASYDDVKVGDRIEGYIVEMIARKLADSR